MRLIQPFYIFFPKPIFPFGAYSGNRLKVEQTISDHQSRRWWETFGSTVERLEDQYGQEKRCIEGETCDKDCTRRSG